ncbi:MAG: cadherin-like domain-containing protein [Pseudomonadota bacterium]
MATISGDQMTWHKITLDFEAPQDFSENPSTFRDYRLDVTFTNADTGEVITIPGYFAADGDAANSNATSGNIWRANFNPPSEGNWTYEASFRTGEDIAAKTYAEAPNAGTAVGFIDGDSGSFTVTPTDKTGDDFRAKGMILQDEGTHYLQHQGDQDYFIRGGPGIPENFLANKDFDNTGNGRHDFSTHVSDYKGDGETWDGGKGVAILGAVNYLADQGQNTIYMLSNTSGGDGQDVSPWTFAAQNTPKNDGGLSAGEIDKFSTYDISKLSQWEIVFDHMDNKGIYKNLLLQETENDQQLNNGTEVSGTTLDVERLVYMREMVARFGHNNGIQWNLGEENTNTNAQRADMAEYMKSVDGYDHLVTIHSYPNQIDQVYNPLLDDADFDGASFQTNRNNIRDRIEEFRDKSAANGDKWVLTWDEDASGTGKLEAGDSNFDAPNQKGQRDAFWGTLTAGGSGGNWYIKDDNAFSLDQNYDDFTQHKALWTWTAAATDFFNTYIPFWDMKQADGLTSDNDDYVMAKDGEYYVIYLPYGEAGDVRLNLSGQGGEQFDVFWYNPRTGGDLIADGQVDGGGTVQIGGAPSDGGKDWVLLVRNVDAPELPTLPSGQQPQPMPTPTPPAPGPVAPPASDGAFQGKDGTIVMQAESAEAQGNWRETTVDGETVLLWDAPSSNYNKVDPDETLSYTFVTDEAGNYHIGLHSGRVKSAMGQSELFEKDGKARTDTGNDAYVAVIDVATGEVVQKPTKLFTGLGGSDRDLRFGSTFDANHNKSPAVVTLEAGKEYRLEITGRSDGYALDMITLNKGGVLRDANAAESARIDGQAPPPPQPPANPGPNTAPVAQDDAASTGQNNTIVVDVLANDSDANGDNLTLTDVSYSGNTSIVSIVDGKISVNPLSAVQNARTEVITYTVSDGKGGTDTATLRVDVGGSGPAPTPPAPTPPAPTPPANQAPVAANDIASTVQNRTVVVDVLANDSDPEGGNLTLTDVSYDGTTSLVSIVDGKISVNPLQAATNDRTEVITYTVADAAGNETTATLRVDVGTPAAPTPTPPAPPANAAPTAVDDAASTAQNTTIVVDVLANDSDADDDALTLSDVSYDGTTSLVSIENGQIKVNPLQAATNDRVETITYTVTDADGATDTATLNVSVGGGAAPTPPAAPDLGLMLSVIDAETDAIMSMLKDGDTITLEDMSTALNFAATAGISGVGSMKLSLDDGPAQIENVTPYAAFGNVGPDFFGAQIAAGSHTLKIEVYAKEDGQGELLGTETIQFDVVEKLPEPDGLLNFYIADAVSNDTIGGLADGDTLDAATLGDNATFYATTDSADVEYVRLTFEGETSTEKVAPYALFGDIDGDFRKGVDLDPGDYSLQAQAFGAKGTLLETVDLQFEVL